MILCSVSASFLLLFRFPNPHVLSCNIWSLQPLGCMPEPGICAVPPP